MIDRWHMYFADMEGSRASVVFNDGISETINALPHQYGCLITTQLRETNEENLTTNAENLRLTALGEDLLDLIKSLGGHSLGRVTGNGKRWSMYLLHDNNSETIAQLARIGKRHDYQLDIRTRVDLERALYWDDLYPDADSWQAVGDLEVISNLNEDGNDNDIPREIDHAATFESKSKAKAFAIWLEEFGHHSIEIDPVKGSLMGKKTYWVHSKHIGKTFVGDISQHSMPLSRKAKELGGEYDGWGTYAVNSDSN